VANIDDGTASFEADLRRFEFGMVYVPILNDMIRRSEKGEESRAIRAEVRKAMTGAELRALVRDGHRRLALAAWGARSAYPLYGQAYRLFRRLKWGSVGYW
jgi:hypothetical protein